jgi:hypothetical protein
MRTRSKGYFPLLQNKSIYHYWFQVIGVLDSDLVVLSVTDLIA